VNDWYSTLGSRQTGTQECGLSNQIPFQVVNYLTQSLVPGYFASATSSGWTSFPDKIKATLFTGSICTQQCLKVTPCCYNSDQSVIAYAGNFPVSVGQVYLVNGVIASSQSSGSVLLTIRDRSNFGDLSENVEIGFSRTANTWTSFQTLLPVTKNSKSARLDLETSVSQGMHSLCVSKGLEILSDYRSLRHHLSTINRVETGSGDSFG